MSDRDEDIGYLRARVDGIEKVVGEIRTDVKTVIAHVEQSKGARRTWTQILGAATVIAGLYEVVKGFWH